jgi:four helix bundle protein
MARIAQFGDIEAWRKARELTREVYRVTRSGAFQKDFRLIDQIRAASVSVMSNIAEGFERDGNAEFRQSLYTAKGSAGEVRSQLYVALDAVFIDQQTFDRLTALALDAVRLVFGFIRYLESCESTGRKYAP